MDVTQVIPPDAIPSVDDPDFVDAYEGDPDDEVVVLELDGEARAYPIRYLNYHEIVNDRIGDRHVAVTWCPLCGSAVVYDRTVDGRTSEFGASANDGSGGSKGNQVLSFGVSGKLADDDLVMYDRETDSEWKQSLGEAIAGEHEGASLDVLPAALMPYQRFAETHPDGVVLAEPGGRSEASGHGDDPEPIEYEDDPYRDYFEAAGFGLGAHRGTGGRDWRRDDLEPKDVVLGVDQDGNALGFPYDHVEAAGGVVQAAVGDLPVAVFVTADGIHAFEANGLTFEPTDDPREFTADGTTWDGATGEAGDGRRLRRIPARRLFAFAWQDDHGPDAFFEPSGQGRE